MSEPSTCGQGLAENAALPAALAQVTEAMASMLERHMIALDMTDSHAAAEHAVYGELAAAHRRIAEQLRAAADGMDAQRDLPMGPHDMAAIMHPATMRAFHTLVEAKRHLATLLRDTAAEDDAMLEMMRGAARTGKVICDITTSVDGYSAGLDQTEERPFGDDGGDGTGDKLHAWMFDTPEENRVEVDQWAAAKAFIMGRNMFGPVRGEWDRPWNGWWGEDPPFHGPVFVLTHHARDPQPMDGGTTYHFVTDGIESALAQARAAAGDGDVVIAGGATTINQYLAAGLVDELRLHIVPLTLGAGTRLFEGVPPVKLEQVTSRGATLVTHVTYRVLS